MDVEDFFTATQRRAEQPNGNPQNSGDGGNVINQKDQIEIPDISFRGKVLMRVSWMHIEKSFFDNVFNTTTNIKGKTKDSDKARMDVSMYCACRDLELQPLGNGKIGQAKAYYTLSLEDGKLMYKCMNELRMLDGYASKLSRCVYVNKGKIHGMKRHDFMYSLNFYSQLHLVPFQNVYGNH